MASRDELETLMQAAGEYVRRAIGVELDGSEESLAFVDHYIERTTQKAPVGDDVLALVAAALSAYFGEVARAKLGGEWVLDGSDPGLWQIVVEPVALRFRPVGMAAAALRGDEVAGFDDSFATKPELTGPLSDALSQAPPVEAAYYYSLTGRLETLAHVTDILAELERQRRGAAN